MGGYLPNAPVNEAAHQFIEKKCSEGKHDKGYMTIPFTTQSWFDPAPGPDPVGSFRFPREMRDKELAQHISCSFRRAAEALEKIPQDHPDSRAGAASAQLSGLGGIPISSAGSAMRWPGDTGKRLRSWSR